MTKKDIENIKLTTRQWRLYSLVKYNTSEEHRKTTLEEIVENYNSLDESSKDKYVLKETAHDKCVSVRNDIDKINLSSEIQRIIVVYDDYTYKLAENELEVLEMLERLYYRVAYNKLVKASRIKYKLDKHNQGRLFTNDLRPIYTNKTEEKLEVISKAVREFVEVFENSDTSDKNEE